MTSNTVKVGVKCIRTSRIALQHVTDVLSITCPRESDEKAGEQSSSSPSRTMMNGKKSDTSVAVNIIKWNQS